MRCYLYRGVKGRGASRYIVRFYHAFSMHHTCRSHDQDNVHENTENCKMVLFRRIIPAVKHIQSAQYLIIDHLVPRPDFLLHERDLPLQRPFYLKKTPVEVFAEECKPEDQIFIINELPGLIPARIGIILPLHVDAENVYPLPFIVDTGVPRFFYLGRRCVEVLRDEGVIAEVSDNERYDYILRGHMQYNGQNIKRVYADALPIRYEPKPEDIRANVMGLAALWSFNIWNIRNLPSL